MPVILTLMRQRQEGLHKFEVSLDYMQRPCIGYFSGYYDQILDKSNLKKGGFILAYGLKGYSPPLGEGMAGGLSGTSSYPQPGSIER